jgi:uncharacterized protein YbjT (DUF2867 family)
MSGAPPPSRRVLLLGGGGGLVGRALLEEFSRGWRVRSVHRHPVARETELGTEIRLADIGTVVEWAPILQDVDAVVDVAWFRSGPDRRFRPLAEGVVRCLHAAEAAGVSRWVRLSVPDAPVELEARLPYLVRKRQVDREVAHSRIPSTILRPTMLFGPGDRLLTIMLRTMARWRRFPMFGDGTYHVSPLSARDLARIVRREAEHGSPGTASFGGPTRWVYRQLTDRMFSTLGLPPRYWRMTPRGGHRLAWLLETAGSSLLYAYEVDWLVSDRLGLAPYVGLDPPLEAVEPFLAREAARLRAPG